MSLEAMTIEEYWERIDPNFSKRYVSMPKRLELRYFNILGNPSELLVEVSIEVEKIIEELGLRQDVEEVYIFGTHAKGTFWEGSDLDIALLTQRKESVPNQLNDPLYNQLNERIRIKYPAKEGNELIKGGTIYPVHLHIHVVRPYGIIYDLREKKGITFGKTERDHHDYEWQVLGLRVD